MRNRDDLDHMFDALTDLTLQQRDTIKERYRFLMREYRYRCLLYSILFYFLRVTMTVGSILVPALLSLKTSPDIGEPIYWSTVTISLAVTAANGITTLFKLDKRFFMLHGVAEKIRSETWQYLALSGRYSGHYGGYKPSHRNQYVYYMTYLERLRMRHVDDEFTRQAEVTEQKKKEGGSGNGTSNSNSNDSVIVSVSDSVSEQKPSDRTSTANIPSPPNPADLLTSPGSQIHTHRRRESTTTVGSDDSALEVFEQKPAAKDEKSNTAA
jgi:hypothetical protein